MARKSPFIFLAVVISVVLMVPANAGAQEGNGGPPPPPPNISVGDLDFGPCADFPPDGPPLQCASLAVPLDHDEPDGPTIELNIRRIGAQVPPDEVAGNLFVNPGGPGGNPIGMVLGVGFSGVFADRNILAIDPRGVGLSAPFVCEAEVQEMLGASALAGFSKSSPSSGAPSSGAPSSGAPSSGAPIADPPTSGEPGRDPRLDDIQASIDMAAATVALCRETDGDLIDHVGTANVAKDMELVRQAMGEDKLDYFGASYGTHLGAVYAELFPDNVGRFILDGPILLNNFPAPDIGQIRGFDDALSRFAAGCAAFSDICALGDVDAIAAIEELAEILIESPLPATVEGPDGPIETEATIDDLFGAMFLSLNVGRQIWPDFADALAAGLDGDGSGLAEIAAFGEDDSFSVVTSLAVICLDDPAPASAQDALDINNAETEAGRDRFLNLVGPPDIARCLDTGLSDPLPTIDIDEGETPPILVVGNTHDPATPYQGALEFVESVRSGRLLTVIDDGHTVVARGNPCVNTIAVDFLASGALPPEGTECEPPGLIGIFGSEPGENGGLIIELVVEGSVADGVFQLGDEVLTIDGVDANIQPSVVPGQSIDIVLIRNGEELVVTVIVGPAIFWLPD